VSAAAEPRLREAVPSDLDAIVALLLRLNANGTAADPRYALRPDAGPHLREQLRDLWFGRFLPFPACLVAEPSRGSLAGLISAEVVPDLGILAFAPSARIDNLWVEPPWRRQGLGRALVAQMRARTSAAGYGRLTVSTLARDDRALAFWRAMGLQDLFVVLSDS
jgi:GNAT superfamily N-acetyltransferase